MVVILSAATYSELAAEFLEHGDHKKQTAFMTDSTHAQARPRVGCARAGVGAAVPTSPPGSAWPWQVNSSGKRVLLTSPSPGTTTQALWL